MASHLIKAMICIMNVLPIFVLILLIFTEEILPISFVTKYIPYSPPLYFLAKEQLPSIKIIMIHVFNTFTFLCSVWRKEKKTHVYSSRKLNKYYYSWNKRFKNHIKSFYALGGLFSIYGEHILKPINILLNDHLPALIFGIFFNICTF